MLLRSLSPLLSLLALAACGVDDRSLGAATDPGPSDASAVAGVLTSTGVDCALPRPPQATRFRAHDGGGAWEFVDAEGDTLIQRYRGRGCDLTPIGLPIAGALVDVDDSGAVWARSSPTELHKDGVIATYAIWDTLVRVGSDDVVVNVNVAGRGMWAMGVSQHGDAIMASGCGGLNGVASVDEHGASSELALAADLGDYAAGVFAGADVFFAPSFDGKSLVRSDRFFNVVVGDVDGARLVRCGDRACAVVDDRVVVYGADGSVDDVIDAGGVVDDVTANAEGVFVFAHGRRCGQAFLRFVPR